MPSIPLTIAPVVEQMYVSGVDTKTISSELNLSQRDIARFVAERGLKEVLIANRLDTALRVRYAVEEDMNSDLPEYYKEIKRIALEGDGDKVRLDALKYLMGVHGYSPQTSAERIAAMSAKKEQAEEAARQKATQGLTSEEAADEVLEAIGWETKDEE